MERKKLFVFLIINILIISASVNVAAIKTDDNNSYPLPSTTSLPPGIYTLEYKGDTIAKRSKHIENNEEVTYLFTISWGKPVDKVEIKLMHNGEEVKKAEFNRPRPTCYASTHEITTNSYENDGEYTITLKGIILEGDKEAIGNNFPSRGLFQKLTTYVGDVKVHSKSTILFFEYILEKYSIRIPIKYLLKL